MRQVPANAQEKLRTVRPAEPVKEQEVKRKSIQNEKPAEIEVLNLHKISNKQGPD